MSLRRLVLGMALAAIVGGTWAAQASACSLVFATPKQRLSGASVAVFGRVSAVRSLDGEPSSGPRPAGENFEAKVRVSRVYKGRIGRTIRVRSNTDGASCGAGEFRVGDRIALLLPRTGSPFDIGLPDLTSRRELNAATGGRYHRPGP